MKKAKPEMDAPPSIVINVLGYNRVYLRSFQPDFGMYHYTAVNKADGFQGLQVSFDDDDKYWLATVDGKWTATADEAQKAVENAIEAAAFACFAADKELQK
jgi:hypothetical protein